MSERTLQSILEAAVVADEAGVPVDWKALTVQTYNVAMEEIKRLTPEQHSLMDQAKEMMEGKDLPMG